MLAQSEGLGNNADLVEVVVVVALNDVIVAVNAVRTLVDTLRNVRVVHSGYVIFSRTYDVSLKVIVLYIVRLHGRKIWLDSLT
jgi:hypothetical protein